MVSEEVFEIVIGWMTSEGHWILFILISSPQQSFGFPTQTDTRLQKPGPEVIKLFSCSAQLRLKFILLINVKMPTVVRILTFMSRINYRIL